jgi:hypothetical protein
MAARRAAWRAHPEEDFMLHFVCEKAVVLAIAAALTSMVVVLGYPVLEFALRFIY